MPTEEQTYRQGMVETVNRIETKIDKVDQKVTYTNGKVKKLIIAVVAIACLLIGYTAKNLPEVVGMFLHFI